MRLGDETKVARWGVSVSDNLSSDWTIDNHVIQDVGEISISLGLDYNQRVGRSIMITRMYGTHSTEWGARYIDSKDVSGSNMDVYNDFYASSHLYLDWDGANRTLSSADDYLIEEQHASGFDPSKIEKVFPLDSWNKNVPCRWLGQGSATSGSYPVSMSWPSQLRTFDHADLAIPLTFEGVEPADSRVRIVLSTRTDERSPYSADSHSLPSNRWDRVGIVFEYRDILPT